MPSRLLACVIPVALCVIVSCSDEAAPADPSSGPGSGNTSGAGASGGAGSTGGATGSGGGSGGMPSAGPANVVFVLADDFSWNLVQYMPNLLEMQKAGMTFENYFVTDSLCCPSRTSILTGRFPHDSGVFTNAGKDGGYETFKKKGNETVTFANTLSEAAGYRTALMGKYLNGYDPTVLAVPPGWTSWAVAGNGYKNFDYDLNQTGDLQHYGNADKAYLTDVVAGLGADFIGADPAKPLLLEIATFAPHSPYTPAPRHEKLFPGLELPKTPPYGAKPGPAAPEWLKGIPALTADEKQKIDADFRKRVQAVQAIDEMLGALHDAVALAGKGDSTYFVFSSDNGYHMGEHSLRPGKQTAFDTDIRVPLVVTGPGVPAGKVMKEIVQNVDLCPTFAEMGVTSPPPTANGRSILPLLRGEAVADFRNAALIEHHGDNFDPTDPDLPEPDSGKPPTYSALRAASFVYVEYVGGELEFHDHATDPHELANTAGGLSDARKKALHDTLEAMKGCHDEGACWTAQHLLPGAE